MHTPSTPKVSQPASATDPRFSTSGILNSQITEQNRQGLLSTYGGRNGQVMNINKFANKKIEARDPSAVSVLEQAAKLYQDVKNKGYRKGITTGHSHTAGDKIKQYNSSIDAVNQFMASYGVQNKNPLMKAELNEGKQRAHSKHDIKATLDVMGNTGETFNELEAAAKKQKTPKQ